MQVILVGHDIGGACISYVMELYPSKVSAAIFVAAAMLKSGQSTLDMFSVQVRRLYLVMHDLIRCLQGQRQRRCKEV